MGSGKFGFLNRAVLVLRRPMDEQSPRLLSGQFQINRMVLVALVSPDE
jgi:hypothetical protein